ncbi:MAG: serine hydrolase domain-containing protein, partial [bacterium]
MKSYQSLLFILLMSFLMPARGQDMPGSTPLQDGLSTYADSLVIKKMEKFRIPGAALVIADRNGILLLRGYGYSDLSRRIPVDPHKTLFRIASVSKTVTGTAVMQCVERGLLDLHTDINNYLKDFQIKNTFSKPITLADLMTHTGGFDEFVTGKSARTQEEVQPLKDFLMKDLTRRIRPPGEISSYSNIGIALAAYVVESVTGKDFDTYCRENIFTPLGMKNTGFRLDEAMRQELATTYTEENGKSAEFSFDYLRDYPAGQLVTSAEAFSKFMICHLDSGKYGNTRILSPQLTEDMHRVHFTHNSYLHSGYGWTFVTDTLNDAPYIYHGGGYPGTSTMLIIFPDRGFGIFIAANLIPSNGSFVYDVVHGLASKMIPLKTPDTVKYPLIKLPSYDRNVDRFTGLYRFTRFPGSGLTKTGLLMGLAGPELPVWKNSDGMLMMNNLEGKPRRLIQVKPLVFRSIDDRYYIAFRQDEKGRITHLFTDGTSAFERIPGFLGSRNQRALFFFCLVFLIIFAVLPLFTWRKRMKESDLLRTMHKLSGLISTTFMIYYLAWSILVVFYFSKTGLELGFAYGVPFTAYIFQAIPILGIILFVSYLYYFFKSISRPGIPALFQVYHCFYFVMTTIYIWFIWYWNILGFR